ncbi:TPA: hypothetical protein ACGO9F_002062 [Streptococcus suis]
MKELIKDIERKIYARENFSSYDTKIIASGDTIEVYKMTTKQRKGYKSANAGAKKRSFSELSDLEKLDSIERKKKNLKQKRIDVMRLISANFRPNWTKFVTLTFAEHVTDREVAMNEFKKFIKRFNYQERKAKRADVRYIGVIEYTKKGRIHFHVVFFNCPYIPKERLQNLWDNGFVYLNNIRGMNGSAVARYVTKYMAKAFASAEADLEELFKKGVETFKQKDYFASTNLKRPQIIYMNNQSIDEIELLKGYQQGRKSAYERKIFLGTDENDKPILGSEMVEYYLFEKSSSIAKNIA